MMYLLFEIESASRCKKKNGKLEVEISSGYESNDVKTHQLTLEECAARFFNMEQLN